MRFRHCRATVMEGKLHKSGLLFTLISTFAEREEIKGKQKPPNLLVEGWGFLFLRKYERLNIKGLSQNNCIWLPLYLVQRSQRSLRHSLLCLKSRALLDERINRLDVTHLFYDRH